jgi:HPt (histidine-containing phosphotransfer) domain-containing protein
MLNQTQSFRPESPIDPAVIEGLRAIEARGGQGLLRKIVTRFAATGPAAVADMRAKLAAGADEQLWRAAHGLKSSASVVGAVHVSARCVEIEQVVRRDGAGAAAVLIGALEADLASAIERLQAVLTGIDAAVR